MWSEPHQIYWDFSDRCSHRLTSGEVDVATIYQQLLASDKGCGNAE